MHHSALPRFLSRHPCSRSSAQGAIFCLQEYWSEVTARHAANLSIKGDPSVPTCHSLCKENAMALQREHISRYKKVRLVRLPSPALGVELTGSNPNAAYGR